MNDCHCNFCCRKRKETFVVGKGKPFQQGLFATHSTNTEACEQQGREEDWKEYNRFQMEGTIVLISDPDSLLFSYVYCTIFHFLMYHFLHKQRYEYEQRKKRFFSVLLCASLNSLNHPIHLQTHVCCLVTSQTAGSDLC